MADKPAKPPALHDAASLAGAAVATHHRAAIDNANDAIIQAAINTVGNPSPGATAQLTEETLIVLHSLYFLKMKPPAQPAGRKKPKGNGINAWIASAGWLNAAGAGCTAEN